MDWIGYFTILAGVFNLATAGAFLYSTYLTWANPHPVGRRFMPELVFALGLDYANNGLRKISFVFDSSPLTAYVAEEGVVRLAYSNALTLVLCVLVITRTVRMIKDFKKGIA